MIRVVPIDAYFDVYTLDLSVLLDMLARLSLNRLRMFSAATALRRYSGQWPSPFLFKGQEPLLGQLRSSVEADMRLRCCRNLWICNSVQFILEVKDTISGCLEDLRSSRHDSLPGIADRQEKSKKTFRSTVNNILYHRMAQDESFVRLNHITKCVTVNWALQCPRLPRYLISEDAVRPAQVDYLDSVYCTDQIVCCRVFSRDYRWVQ